MTDPDLPTGNLQSLAILAPEEKERVLAELDSPRFADKSAAQAYTILLDKGCYLCSQATVRRLLRERGTSGERRAHAVHPAKKKPELVATGPDDVWGWDITKLRGPARGILYQLYALCRGGIRGIGVSPTGSPVLAWRASQRPRTCV
jgi:hypothetical protein